MNAVNVKYLNYKFPFSYRDFIEWGVFKSEIEKIVSKWESYDYIKTSMENGDLTEFINDKTKSIFDEPFSGVFLKENESQELVLLDIFYAYMWSYSYFFLVLHDYSIANAKIKSTIPFQGLHFA